MGTFGMKGMWAALVACAAYGAVVAEPAASDSSDVRLVGDGVHDDTAAIQARLDSGANCVYLPPPVKEYLISRPLAIGSDQELRLDRLTRIRLAPKSNCHMLVNRDREKGDRRIAVTGGVWDYDNLRQKCNQGLWMISDDPEYNRPKYTDGKYRPDRYLGVAMYFENVTDLELSGVTFRNPVTYAAQFCKVSYFTVRDIIFDFTTWNPAKSNMDGVHFDGCCHHGRITNLRGTCFDDMVALNANDVHCAAQEGPITDIDIDGVYADYSHSAVRLLSTNADCPVKRITIRNVHGNFYRYAVGLTRLLHNRPGRGVMDDIVIEDCSVGSAPWPDDLPPLLVKYFRYMPIVFCDNRLDIGHLTIRNLHRIERADPVPTISLGRETHVANLTVRDCVQENHLASPLIFLQNLGQIDRKTMDNIQLRTAPDAATNILETTDKLWTDRGLISDGKIDDGGYPEPPKP